jgi:hypothetical protein
MCKFYLGVFVEVHPLGPICEPMELTFMNLGDGGITSGKLRLNFTNCFNS